MDGVLSGAALFFARNVVSDELFIDEAVGLHVELGKGRIDAEFLCVEEAFEPMMATKRGTRSSSGRARIRPQSLWYQSCTGFMSSSS